MKHNTRQINLNQLMTLIILFLMGGSILALAARHSGQNAWIVVLIGGFFGSLFFTMYYRISKLHNYQGLPNILKETFGKFIGTILLISYAGFFLFRHLAIGNYMTAMAQETLMFGASHRTVIFLLLSTVVVASFYGLNVIGRSSEIFLVIILLCLSPFLLSIFRNDIFKIDNLTPLLADGALSIAPDIVRSIFFPFGELVAFMMLFPYVSKKENNAILKRSYIGIGLAIIIIIAVDLTTVGLIGADLTTNFEYPLYHAMQLVGIQGFLGRLDFLAIIIMVASEYFKLVTYFFVSILALQALNKRFNFKIILGIVTLFIFFFGPYFNLHETSFVVNVMPYKILPIFEFGIPLLVWVVSEVKFRKKKPDTPPVNIIINPEPT